MGRVGRGHSYVPFRRRSRHHLGGTYRLLRAQLARATRGSARVLLAVCSETVASQTHGRVGQRLEMQLSGLPCATRGFTSGSGVSCSIPTA